MEGLKPPQPLQFEGNTAENWKKWKQTFGMYMTHVHGCGAELVHINVLWELFT